MARGTGSRIERETKVSAAKRPRAGASVSSAKLSRGLLSRREVAALAGVGVGAIDKAIEQRAVPTRRHQRQTFLDSDGVALITIFAQAKMALPVKVKQQVHDWIVREQPHRGGKPAALAVSETIVVRCGAEVGERVRAAEDYARLRDRYVEINPTRLGGAPVIKGTRISVHGVTERIADGDTIDVLLEDYPYVPQEAFEIALVYAKANPRRGRPARPWRDTAPARA